MLLPPFPPAPLPPRETPVRALETKIISRPFCVKDDHVSPETTLYPNFRCNVVLQVSEEIFCLTLSPFTTIVCSFNKRSVVLRVTQPALRLITNYKWVPISVCFFFSFSRFNIKLISRIYLDILEKQILCYSFFNHITLAWIFLLQKQHMDFRKSFLVQVASKIKEQRKSQIYVNYS